MPSLPWLNANAHRSFPFLAGTAARPGADPGSVEAVADDVVVDAGFVAGPASGFDPAADRVYLQRVRRAGGRLYFDFESDAPGLAGVTLTFGRDVSAAAGETEYADADTAGGYDPADSAASESASEALAGSGDCFQMGDSGTVVAAFDGRLRLYFNDDRWDDNFGGWSVAIAGNTYFVPPADPNGVDGPDLAAGHSYPYTASGVIRYHPNGSTAAPGGVIHGEGLAVAGIADDRFVCPGLQKFTLVGKLFLRSPVLTDSESASLADACPPEPPLSGYLVTGRLDALLALLPGDGVLTRAADDAAVVEPALVRSLAGGYVDSLNLANVDRTRASAPAGCDPTDWGFPVGGGRTYVAARCLRGDIRLKPGYNSVVRAEADDNRLTLGAAVGAGEGPACEEVPLFGGEAPPPGSDYLSGGPACNAVLRSINGSGGRFASVVGGQGVRVSADPENHAVVVDVNLSRMAVCAGDGGFSEVSESL